MDNTIIIPIITPELQDSNYGEKINEQFDNINRNFESLASLPFIKGEKGEGIKVFNVELDQSKNQPLEPLIYDGKVPMTPAYICSKILEYSALGVINDNLQEVGGISRGDFLNGSHITLLYYTENGKNILSSIHPYVFKDARFYNISNENPDGYVDAIDTSCIVCYQEKSRDEEESRDGWTILSNIPKLYYDKKLKTFCWKLNGSETGIIATGPKGESGARGNLRLVTISIENGDENDNRTTYPIKNVAVTRIDKEGKCVVEFVEYADLKSTGEVKFSDGDAVVVFADPSSPGYADKGHYWIALITSITGTEYVTIPKDLSVQGYDARNGLIQSMKSIGSPEAGSVGLNGLFIPVSTSSTESHIFYSKDGELRMSVVEDGVSTDGLIESNDGKLYINYDIEARSIKSPEIITSTLKANDIQASALHLIGNPNNEREEDLTFQILKDMKDTLSSYKSRLEFETSSGIITLTANPSFTGPQGGNLHYIVDPFSDIQPSNKSGSPNDYEVFQNNHIEWFDKNSDTPIAAMSLYDVNEGLKRIYFIGDRAINNVKLVIWTGSSGVVSNLKLDTYKIPNARDIENHLKGYYNNNKVPVGATISIDIVGSLDQATTYYLYKNDSNLKWIWNDRVNGKGVEDLEPKQVGENRNMGETVTLVYTKNNSSTDSDPCYNVRTITRW